MIRQLLQRLKLKWSIRRGLQVGEGSEFEDCPEFGSEPYLITIGRHVKVGRRVTFVSHDGGTWVFRSGERYREVIHYGRIIIHDNCYIGMGTTLMPGVTIGPDALVAPGSIVTRDVPPGTVVAGIPARQVETLEAYGERLLATAPPLEPGDPKAELLRRFPRPW